MNVSELTDVELNRAMIWLYPASIYGCYTRDRERTVYWSKVSGVYQAVDYLLNWNLTMPLAVENMNKIKNMEDIGYLLQETFKPALRAICEVLVMIKVEDK
tara:strand:- start:63 stop:365 length:303 start_codon:yes stop_codon:yes gene_type:complete